MGFLDKIKNALFEVEYVEVEEEKKADTLPEEEKKPIAKKVVLPEKKEEKIEQLQEEELKDEDFEIRPKNEEIKEKEEFKLMDEEDFRVEEDVEVEKPKFEETLETYPTYSENSSKETNTSWNAKQSKLYGIDKSYEIEMHPYGTESKEEKTFFRPSPIISPIYGILDKNYKKEDVKERKEISSSYASSHTTVDEVRRKAYGETKEEEKKVEPPAKFDVEEEESLLVDLSDRSKPEVKELTMGDAIEYFQDLGLEYNVDYVDVSKEKQTPQK
ncbi:MAG: hypothetical protein IJI60_03705, partial [Bacilli bacterium]|nr:hypothetical protein [Bacilli bacterium]